MEMNWFQAQTNEPLSLSCNVRYPHLELFYPLSGDGFWATNGKEFSLAANTSNFLFVQNTKIYSELTPKEKVVMMELRIDLRHFKQLIAENKHLFEQSFFLSANIQSLLHSSTNRTNKELSLYRHAETALYRREST